MSSNKTANLQLNQWAAGDSFLREEFNQDNSKIDAGVGALDAKIDRRAAEVSKENCMVKLMDWTSTTTSIQFDLDVSRIDWSKYTEVIFYGNLLCDSTSNNRINARILINGHKEANAYKMQGASGNNTPYCGLCIAQTATAFPRNRYSIQSMGEGFTLCSENFLNYEHITDSGGCLQVPKLTDVHTINILMTEPNIKLLPGSRFVFYGVRI